MLVKTHRLPGARPLLAVCDKELAGKTFSSKDAILDLSTGFYSGAETTEEDTLGLAQGCGMMNVVGKRSVDFALRAGLVQSENVKTICRVPYAHVLFTD